MPPRHLNRPNTEFARAFTIDNIPLTRLIVWRFRSLWKQAGMEFDDALQTALIHLLNAARYYDPARGEPSTFIKVVLRRHFSQTLARLARHRRGNLSAVLCESRLGSDEASAMVAATKDRAERRHADDLRGPAKARDTVRHILELTTPKLRETVTAMLEEGTMAGAGVRMGIKTPAVWKRVAQIRDKFGKELANES